MAEPDQTVKTKVLRLMDESEASRFTGRLVIDYKQGAVMGGEQRRRF